MSIILLDQIGYFLPTKEEFLGVVAVWIICVGFVIIVLKNKRYKHWLEHLSRYF